MIDRDAFVDLCLEVAEIPDLVAETGLVAALRAVASDPDLIALAAAIEPLSDAPAPLPQVPQRDFPAIDAWRRVIAAGTSRPQHLTRLEIRPPRNENDKGDHVYVVDPLRYAAAYELSAREWYAAARRATNAHTVGVCLRSCDQLLERSLEVLAAAEVAERKAHAA